jgi:hypothetical protein
MAKAFEDFFDRSGLLRTKRIVLLPDGIPNSIEGIGPSNGLLVISCAPYLRSNIADDAFEA